MARQGVQVMNAKLMLAGAVLASAMASGAAQAAPLAAGGFGPAASGETYGGTVLDSVSGTITPDIASPTFTASYTETVYKDPNNTFGAGDLDFVINFSNNSGSRDAIESFSTSNFQGFSVDAGYAPLREARRPAS